MNKQLKIKIMKSTLENQLCLAKENKYNLFNLFQEFEKEYNMLSEQNEVHTLYNHIIVNDISKFETLFNEFYVKYVNIEEYNNYVKADLMITNESFNMLSIDVFIIISEMLGGTIYELKDFMSNEHNDNYYSIYLHFKYFILWLDKNTYIEL